MRTLSLLSLALLSVSACNTADKAVDSDPPVVDSPTDTESDADTDADSDTDTDTDADTDTDTDTDTGPAPDTAPSTAESCSALVTATEAFLASLDAEQVDTVSFDLDEINREDWSNLPVVTVPRDGLRLENMTETQQALAYAMLESSLSAAGYSQALEIISLETWGYDNGDTNLGVQYYTWAIYGTPGATTPWAWQFDGHHLVYNFTVLCDAVVMAPNLVGVYPTLVPEDGSVFAGIRAMADEMDRAVDFMLTLTDEQRAVAVGGEVDNVGLVAGPNVNGSFPEFEGLPASELDSTQTARLLDLIAVWVSDQDEPFIELKMAEIEANLADTYILWFGPVDPTQQFYYRIHGPTVYIELDHGREAHIHAVYRNPLDDYGYDLLASHLRRFH